MRGLFFLILLIPSAAWAAPESTAPSQPSCEHAAVEALAKAANVAVKDLDGINGTTKITVRYDKGSVAALDVMESSGNAALDDIAANCIRADKDVTGSATVSRAFAWRQVMAASAYSAPPRSKGAPHICLSDFPPQAVREGRRGTTELVFDVTAEGTVDALIVSASSGHVDLDLASTHCAAKWQYAPATDNGVAVKVAWEAMVSWTVDHRPAAAAPKIKLPYTNCVTANAEAARQAPNAGVTIVRYALENGEVTAAAVSASSGDAGLDAQAARCVKSWRFESNDFDNPSSGEFRAFIDWHQKILR